MLAAAVRAVLMPSPSYVADEERELEWRKDVSACLLT